MHITCYQGLEFPTSHFHAPVLQHHLTPLPLSHQLNLSQRVGHPTLNAATDGAEAVERVVRRFGAFARWDGASARLYPGPGLGSCRGVSVLPFNRARRVKPPDRV